jgi:hypothetical protein
LRLSKLSPSPNQFFSTESDNSFDTDEFSGYEDMGLYPNSVEYNLQQIFRERVAKARDISRGQTKLEKILYEIKKDDRAIDRSFRLVLSAAKKSAENGRITIKRPNIVKVDAFSQKNGAVLTVSNEDSIFMTVRDSVAERAVIDRFSHAVQYQHSQLLKHVKNMVIPNGNK